MTTRTLTFSPTEFNLVGAGASLQYRQTMHIAIQVNHGIDAAGFLTFRMPTDWDGNDFTIRYRLCVNGTSNGNVVLYAQLYRDRAALLLSSTPEDNINMTTAVGAVADTPVDKTGTVTGTNYVAGDMIALRYFANRSVGGDTNTDFCYLLGVSVEYVPRLVTNLFSPNTKIKSAEVNQNNIDLQ